MPKLNRNCFSCERRIPQEQFADGLVIRSDHTGRSWCWDCTKAWIHGEVTHLPGLEVESTEGGEKIEDKDQGPVASAGGSGDDALDWLRNRYGSGVSREPRGRL